MNAASVIDNHGLRLSDNINQANCGSSDNNPLTLGVLSAISLLRMDEREADSSLSNHFNLMLSSDAITSSTGYMVTSAERMAFILSAQVYLSCPW